MQPRIGRGTRRFRLPRPRRTFFLSLQKLSSKLLTVSASFCVVFSPFFLHFELDTKRVKRREENKKKKKNNNERVKEREIPGGGGKTCIIFDLSQRESKAFCDLIRTTTLRARTTQQH